MTESCLQPGVSPSTQVATDKLESPRKISPNSTGKHQTQRGVTAEYTSSFRTSGTLPVRNTNTKSEENGSGPLPSGTSGEQGGGLGTLGPPRRAQESQAEMLGISKLVSEGRSKESPHIHIHKLN